MSVANRPVLRPIPCQGFLSRLRLEFELWRRALSSTWRRARGFSYLSGFPASPVSLRCITERWWGDAVPGGDRRPVRGRVCYGRGTTEDRLVLGWASSVREIRHRPGRRRRANCDKQVRPSCAPSILFMSVCSGLLLLDEDPEQHLPHIMHFTLRNIYPPP